MKRKSPCEDGPNGRCKKYDKCEMPCDELEKRLPQMRDGNMPSIDAGEYYEDAEGIIHDQDGSGD